MSEKCLLLWDFARRVLDFNNGKFLPDAFFKFSAYLQLLEYLRLHRESHVVIAWQNGDRNHSTLKVITARSTC